MHEVTLVFDDGRVARFPADEADTVYLAALKGRVRILTDCLEGACATCKGVCTSGGYTLESHEEEALSAAERERGVVLTCRMHATSDCVIEFPYASRVALKAAPATVPCRVVEVGEAAENVAALVLESGGAEMRFLPGQYVHLSVPGSDAERSYSFANRPGDGRHTFFVKLLERGAMSEYVSGRAAPGDEIAMTGPFGHFYLRPPVRPVVMVAGGTGLAPMLSMLDTLAASEGPVAPLRLLYGANSAEELFALDRLAGHRGLGLETTLCVVSPPPGWTGASGHVTSLLGPDVVGAGDCEVYLCGPPPMIEAAEAALAGLGVDAGRIHAERFVAS